MLIYSISFGVYQFSFVSVNIILAFNLVNILSVFK